MNNRPTFNEQYNKIVTAYMKNELDPFSNCACFVGNLINNRPEWSLIRNFKRGDVDSMPTEEEFNRLSSSEGIGSLLALALKTIIQRKLPIDPREEIFWKQGGSAVENTEKFNTDSPDTVEYLVNLMLEKECNNLYTKEDIIGIEDKFLRTYVMSGKTEDSLFKAMSETLETLRGIHEAHGEVVDDYNFQKRELVEA